MEDDDIFSAFAETAEDPTESEPEAAPARVTAGEDPLHPGMFAVFIDGDQVEQGFLRLEEAQEAIPDWEQHLLDEPDMSPKEISGSLGIEPSEPVKKPMCGICGNVGVNSKSLQINGMKVCKSCHLKNCTKPKEIAGGQSTGPSAFPCVAYEKDGGVIWGYGSSELSSIMDGNSNYGAQIGYEPQEPLQIAVCSDALGHQLRTCGGDPDRWSGNGWMLKDGIATFLCFGPAEEKVDNAKAMVEALGLVKSEDPKLADVVEPESVGADSVTDTLLADATKTLPASGEPEPIRTEAGVIDPETGEIIEASLIMRKFGWSEMPRLGTKPIKPKVGSPMSEFYAWEEDTRYFNQGLKDYELRLDQVLDLMLSYCERTDRWRASTELRCKPLDSAAKFYDHNFIIPMSKELAPHRLPTYKSGKKKGEYSSKTLALPSGAIKFTSSGGFYVHDAALVKAHIQKLGVDKFAAIGAEQVITYNYQKLLSALNKGDDAVYKDLPGTGTKQKNPFASVKAVSPEAAAHTKEEEDE